jgi:hypothetical protein
MRTGVFGLAAILATPMVLPEPAHCSDPREHDGFFLRLSAGAAWAKTEIHDEPSGDTIKLDGPAAGANFAIGGVVATNLAIHGTFFGWVISDPDAGVTGFSEFELNGELVVSGIGGGITYYFMPENFYLSASAGAATLSLENGNASVESDTGIAGDVTLGREWWVGDSWGLGFAIGLSLHSIPDGGIDESWTGMGLALRFSATLN